MTISRTRAFLFVAAGILLAGCSGEVSVGIGEGFVGEADLEAEVSAQLAAEVGETPESVDCEDGLETEEGADVRCVITAEDGSQVGATVTLLSAEDGEARFDIEVDDQALDE